MVIFPSIYGYAILKHNLMDIRIAVTRAGIFLFVYSFVLGIPFALTGWGRTWLVSIFGERWFWVPLAITACLATLGPFIYGRLRGQAEAVLLARQRRYQNLLLEAAQGMLSEHRLERLLKLIVYIVKRIVNLEFAAIFIKEPDAFAYSLKASRGRRVFTKALSLAETDPLVSFIKQTRKVTTHQDADAALKDYPRAHLIVPCFIQEKLLGFLLLGEKSDHALYTEDDIKVFEILSRQTALAIENCLFWEDEKTRIAREEQIRRQKSIDHFSASLVHEIGNPVFAAQSGIMR